MEQMYRFINKSGHCFEDYQKMGESECDKDYHDSVGAMLRASHDGKHDFSVGDFLCFRDELQEAGFVWGVDFYAKKVHQEEDVLHTKKVGD